MPLQQGEPILESKLASEGAKAGLSALVAKGKRAVTVKVNEVVGVAGFALPGNYVDVMVNMEGEGARRADRDASLSKIVLQRILVLAVAQETSTDVNKPKVVSAVTLELTPEEAEKLDLARSVGNLSLVLRNQIDQEAVQTAGATKAKLLGAANEPAAAKAPAAGPIAPQAGTARRVVKRAAAPPQVASASGNRCVTVLTGMEASRECF
jgi:pilus assembly protein CpaB